MNQAEESIISSMGGKGGKRIADTNLTTPDGDFFVFVAIQAETESVIATSPGNIAGLDGATIPAGAIIYGRFDSITLTSGTVIAYHGWK